MTTKTRSQSKSKSKGRPTAKTEPAVKLSKSDQARAIFERLHATSPRKDIISLFIDEVGLTPSGASTYYQKFLTESKTIGGNGRPRHTTGTATRRGRPPDASSKAGMARALFKKMLKSPRKDVVAAFETDIGLTPAGASTYYQLERNRQAA